MQRAAPYPTAGVMLAAGRRQLVVVAVQLHHARSDEVPRGVVEREAAHIERPQVERGATFEHPLGHHLARTAAGSDAVQEAGGEEEVVEFGGAAHHEVGVGGVGDGAVDERADPCCLEHRGALHGQLGQLREPVVVRVEQLALERVGDAVDTERHGVGLVAAHQQAGAIGLVVHEMVGVAHRGHTAQFGRGELADRPAEQVLVLDRHGGGAHTGQAGHLHTPHTGRVHHHLAGDVAAGGVHGGDPAAVDGDSFNTGLLDDAGAALASALGDGHGDAGRVDVAVGG